MLDVKYFNRRIYGRIRTLVNELHDIFTWFHNYEVLYTHNFDYKLTAVHITCLI